jgi:hypothetical protein
MRFRRWLMAQLTWKGLLHTLVALGFFGYLPGFWTIGFPLLVIYCIAKKQQITNSQLFLRIHQLIQQITVNALLTKIVDLLTNPLRLLYSSCSLFLTLYSFLYYPTPFNFIILWGLYRNSTRDWLLEAWEDMQAWFVNININLQSYQAALHQGQALNYLTRHVMLPFLALVGMTQMLGIASISWLLYIGFFMLANGIGWSTVRHDMGAIRSNLARLTMEHAGKLLGMVAGYRLAHRVIRGAINGNLGQASGTVQAEGLLGVLLPSYSFWGPGGAQTNLPFLSRTFITPMGRIFYTLMTGTFFSQSVEMQGQIWGTVGPTSLQIVNSILLGAATGYLLELGGEQLCYCLREDIIRGYNATVQARQTLSNWWNEAALLRIMQLTITGGLSLGLWCSYGQALTELTYGSFIAAWLATVTVTGILVNTGMRIAQHIWQDEVLTEVDAVITEVQHYEPGAVPILHQYAHQAQLNLPVEPGSTEQREEAVMQAHPPPQASRSPSPSPNV